MAETFAQLGRIEAIRQLFEGSGYEPFGEPLWFTADGGECVTTASKVLLEGIDFNLEYFPLKHLGYKSVIAATGELYAVMSHPETLEVSLGVSAKLDYEQIKELWGGVLIAAVEHGYKRLGLDLAPSRNGLSICMNASGRTSGETCSKRPKPQSKDLICVSGSLGAAFLGQQVLERKRNELDKYKMLIASYLKPELDPQAVAQLEEGGFIPSAGYFVSRGLSDAVMRLSRDSGLGAKVYAEKIPFEGNSFALGKELDIDPISAAMNGGEDCRLLYTIPISSFDKFRTNFQTFDIIGHLALSEAGKVLVTPDGLEHPLSSQGWPE
jgi:thiamine-monophosphate kinase